jgi:hypothetical protein
MSFFENPARRYTGQAARRQIVVIITLLSKKYLRSAYIKKNS